MTRLAHGFSALIRAVVAQIQGLLVLAGLVAVPVGVGLEWGTPAAVIAGGIAALTAGTALEFGEDT